MGERQTADSKRQTANGKRQTADSKRQTANGKRQTANGKRQTADGRRQTANGRRQTANGRRQTADGKRQTANGRRQTADSKRQTANGKRQTAIHLCTQQRTLNFELNRMDIQKTIVQQDEWASLKEYTAARIALGRTGTAEPLQSLLAFRMAHANARDAVYAVLDQPMLLHELQILQQAVFTLNTQAASRGEYLQYPDRGRRLHANAAAQLNDFNSTGYDICLVLADGLSATAINNHAIPVLKLLLPLFESARLSVAPVCMVQGGRVAIGDECGYLLKAKLVAVLIGERPGLSSPDSLGVYLTWHPAPGLTDESRNCISNIRPEGLNYQTAAEKIFFLINESLRLQLSGVALKDNAGGVIEG